MARRSRLRIADLQPTAKVRYYIHKPTGQPIPERRTIRNPQNPYHTGIHEAKRSGAALSRAQCLAPARNGQEHYQDVCTDRRVRAEEERLRKLNNRRKTWCRKFGLEV